MQVNKKFVQISKVQCVEAAVAADKKALKEKTDAQGPSSTAEHPFEGKAYVQVKYLQKLLMLSSHELNRYICSATSSKYV